MAEMKNLTINGTQFTLPFAPAGYGLGSSGVSCTDCNNAIANGFYSLSGSTLKNGPSADSYLWYGSMFVVNRLGNMIEQVIFYDNRAAFRSCMDGVWGEWEYLNPPMVLGVEYRTTERYNGAPVYTKLIDLGSMPANGSGKWVEHGTGSQTPIRVCGRIPSHTLPLRTPSDEITISVTSNYVLVFAPASNATDWTGSTGQAQIWYTK